MKAVKAHPRVASLLPRIARALSWGAVWIVLGACGSKPPTPDWQVNAHGSMERSVAAYLSGNARVEAVEFERARSEVASTGRPELVARIELTRCAGRVASLVFEPCAGFEALRQDAPAAERAYADYLAGRLPPQDAALLPPAHRAIAASSPDAAALNSIADPLSRLIAAGVLLQTGRASPAVQTIAVDTASAQGWRRPLLAWLHVQAERAQQGGNAEEAARLRRRIALVEGARAGTASSGMP